MSAIVIAGDTSGTVTLQAPAVAGNTTITLPATGGAMMAGNTSANTAVLFADSGAANGTSGFTFNKASNNVTFANSIVYGGVTLSNSVTGTGSMVLSTAPTITGNATVANLIIGNVSSLTYGGVTVSNSVTGTGSLVLSAGPTLTGAATFSGNSSTISMILAGAAETSNVTSTAATNTINFDVATSSVVYFTANATANWTVNFRASSGTTLNNAMAIGQTVTVAHLVTQGATAYYNNLIQVDGANTTAKWQGGTAPTAGNASGVDAYAYTIVKTANTTFSVFASQTQFK